MISGSGISDPLTLGREENFLNKQAPLRGPPPPPPAPQEGLTVGEGGDVIFLQLTRTFVFKCLCLVLHTFLSRVRNNYMAEEISLENFS